MRTLRRIHAFWRVLLALVLPLAVAGPLLVLAHKLSYIWPKSLGIAQICTWIVSACLGLAVIAPRLRGYAGVGLGFGYFVVIIGLLITLTLWIEAYFFGNFL